MISHCLSLHHKLGFYLWLLSHPNTSQGQLVGFEYKCTSTGFEIGEWDSFSNKLSNRQDLGLKTSSACVTTVEGKTPGCIWTVIKISELTTKLESPPDLQSPLRFFSISSCFRLLVVIVFMACNGFLMFPFGFIFKPCFQDGIFRKSCLDL